MEAPLLRVRQGGRRGALANSRRIDAMEALAASIPCAIWMRQSRRPIRCLSAWLPKLFARSAHNADRLANDIEAGNLSINHFVASVAETPFGGVNDSGYGRVRWDRRALWLHGYQERLA